MEHTNLAKHLVAAPVILALWPSALGVAGVPHCSPLLTDAEDPHTGLHTCTASTFLTEPTPFHHRSFLPANSLWNVLSRYMCSNHCSVCDILWLSICTFSKSLVIIIYFQSACYKGKRRSVFGFGFVLSCFVFVAKPEQIPNQDTHFPDFADKPMVQNRETGPRVKRLARPPRDPVSNKNKQN